MDLTVFVGLSSLLLTAASGADVQFHDVEQAGTPAFVHRIHEHPEGKYHRYCIDTNEDGPHYHKGGKPAVTKLDECPILPPTLRDKPKDYRSLPENK